MSTSELPRTQFPAVPAGGLPIPAAIERLGNGSTLWTAEAPEKLIRYFFAGDEDQAWRAWKKRLARRKTPWPGESWDPSSVAAPLFWGCWDDDLDSALRAVIGSLFDDGQAAADARRRALQSIMAEGGKGPNEPSALLHLACAYAMPVLTTVVAQNEWWELLEQLIGIARDAAILELTSAPLLHQRLAGELPLALATLMPELSACAQLLAPGRQALSAGLEDLLDGEGLPHWRYLSIQRPLVACWTRARSLTAGQAEHCWNDDAEAQYPHAVREMLRLADSSGGSLLVAARAGNPKELAPFFDTAVKLSDNRGNRAVYESLRRKDLKPVKRIAKKLRPAAANHSEWARVAILRPAWKRSSPQLAVAYGGHGFRGELAIGREKLFAGDWPFTVWVDGRICAPIDDWDPVCWVTDKDADYLELEIGLEEGIKLQRQLCLARKDRFLFVADAVLSPCACSLRHSLQMPVGCEVHANLAEESREVRLQTARKQATVLPLSLPEWRVDRRLGELSVDSDHLGLQQKYTGRSLYAPVWIDLGRRRGRKPFTWRQLTVAEERQIVQRDVAVGYRVQFGNKQWLIYRSLTPPRNRTVLGHNLSSDFLIARFGRDGGVKALVEVE